MRLFLLSVLVLSVGLMARADEKLAGIACRSVHLGYQTGPATAFVIETTVKQSAEGTYFCAIGFGGGYFGIQEKADGKKVVIFSVWDPTTGDDKNSVPADQRVKLLFKAEPVRVGRFGGEGTGGQSFVDFDWKIDQPVRFAVEAGADPADAQRTAFTSYLDRNDGKGWMKLVTFSTLAKTKRLTGLYSFVEDFRRNKVSATKKRTAEFGSAWARDEAGKWSAVSKARFTADSNPAMTIDTGPTSAGDRWFLSTGGNTSNRTPLKTVVALPKPSEKAPSDLPK